MSIIENARAIEAALQRLQGPPAAGQLLVKALATDVTLHPGTCALPFDGGAIDPGASIFVKPNPATIDAKVNPGAWIVPSSGLLIDVEAVQGGNRSNRGAGTPYRWDPPETGLELVSTASTAIAGGAYSGAFAGLKQFTHFKAASTNTQPGQVLFMSGTFDYPAVVLGWAGTGPLDGGQAAAPGPRTARTGTGRMLYRNTWTLWIATSRLDSDAARSEEGTTLLEDVLEVLQDARRIRGRAFMVSIEPGAKIQAARPGYVTPTAYVDIVTLATDFVLERRPEERTYHDWLRTRLRQQTPPQAPDPPIDLPNTIIPMPPNGPGTLPFP